MAVLRWKWKPIVSPFVSILSCLSVLAASPAAAAERPPKKECAQTDAFDRALCRQGAITDQVAYTADVIFAEGTKMRAQAGEARVKQIKNARSALRERERKLTAEHFRRQAKAGLLRARGGGHLVPLTDTDRDDEDRDGICDYEKGSKTAKCAAIEVGQNGLQECNPEKKNKGGGKDGLECDLVDTTDADDEAEMEQSAAQVDAIYDTVEDELIGMNDTLDELNASVESESVRVGTLTQPDFTRCVFPSAPDHTKLEEEVKNLRIGAAVLTATARVLATVNNQVVVAAGFGGNSATLRFWIETGAGLANTLYTLGEEELKRRTRIVPGPTIKDCLAQLAVASAQLASVSSATSGKLADLQNVISEERIKALEDKIALLQTASQALAQQQQIMARDDENRAKTVERVEEARWDIIYLLNTPQGQRPDFPVK